MENFKRKFIGDRSFYANALAISVPMIVQSLITNFVSMLDNIMVGAVGTAQMSGVSIVNQFIFVFNLTIFGGLSGASIFGTQFFGKGDHEGQKYTVRFRVYLTLAVIAVFALIFGFFGESLISLFLSEDSDPAVTQATLKYGMDYLKIIMVGMIPFGFGQVYASVVRECGETQIPMIGSMTAIGVNLVLDYGLIFGKLGMPKMGVAGAALATVIAKSIEALVIIIWAHANPARNPYIKGLYKGLTIPAGLTKDILIKGCPLLVNEFFWSMGMSIIAQCYSVRGIEVVAARNIGSTLVNLFNIVFIQTGAATGIILGQQLGAGKLKEARDTDNKMILFSMVISTVTGLLAIPLAKWFPTLYNTEEAIRGLASYYVMMQVLAFPIFSFTNVCYFTLRSGGKTGITFLFDFGFTWFFQIPIAFLLTHLTNMEIHMLMFVVTYLEAFKVIVGYLLIRSDIWIKNLVGE